MATSSYKSEEYENPREEEKKHAKCSESNEESEKKHPPTHGAHSEKKQIIHSVCSFTVVWNDDSMDLLTLRGSVIPILYSIKYHLLYLFSRKFMDINILAMKSRKVYVIKANVCQTICFRSECLAVCVFIL